MKSALGASFSASYLKLKGSEWESYSRHFTEWERANTLDI